MERDGEFNNTPNMYDFGARMYSSRLGKFLSLDPLAKKFPAYTPYSFVNNMPISAIDPDGRDIIVLNSTSGANGAGHQAVLISDGKGGWNYVSKDGGEYGVYGKSKPVIENYKTIEEFANSEHNLIKNDDGSYKTDDNGNKIVRYDKGYLIKTDEATDPLSYEAAKKSAKSTYCLTTADCSHVAKDALDKAKTPEGEQVQNGEYGESIKTPEVVIPKTRFNERKVLFSEKEIPNPNFQPNEKQLIIEKKNKGTKVDKLLIPSS